MVVVNGSYYRAVWMSTRLNSGDRIVDDAWYTYGDACLVAGRYNDVAEVLAS